MFYGRVVGTVVCTVKDAGLKDKKLLVVQRTDHSGEDESGTVIAVDAVQAGIGDFVCLAKGKESSLPFGDITHPMDASIVGIIDRTCIEKC